MIKQMIMIKKVYLFDWGNTIMKDCSSKKGAMYTWDRVEAMPNAKKVLKKLSSSANCYLATNARYSTKEEIYNALRRINLNSYFKDIFCFRDIGFLKPSKEYFDFIINKLDVKKKDIVMVGDNLDTDIRGAEDYGIESILYDYQNRYKDYSGIRIADLQSLID